MIEIIEKYQKNSNIKNIVINNNLENIEKTVKEKASEAGKDAIKEIIQYYNKDNFKK